METVASESSQRLIFWIEPLLFLFHACFIIIIIIIILLADQVSFFYAFARWTKIKLMSPE